MAGSAPAAAMNGASPLDQARNVTRPSERVTTTPLPPAWFTRPILAGPPLGVAGRHLMRQTVRGHACDEGAPLARVASQHGVANCQGDWWQLLCRRRAR